MIWETVLSSDQQLSLGCRWTSNFYFFKQNFKAMNCTFSSERENNNNNKKNRKEKEYHIIEIEKRREMHSEKHCWTNTEKDIII